MPDPTTSEQVNAELQRLQQAYSSENRTGRTRQQNDADYNRFQAEQMRLSNLGSGFRRAEAAQTLEDNQGQFEADRQANYDRTQGILGNRANAVANDPFTRAALERLASDTAGNDAPYSPEVRANLLARQGDMAAASEGVQRENLTNQMAQSGGSISDPSAQAALRELQARRQQQVAAAAGQIDSQANVANFDARQRSAGNLANVQMGVNSQLNQLANAQAGVSEGFGVGSHDNLSKPSGGGSTTITQGNIGGPRPPAQTPAPALPPAQAQQPRPSNGGLLVAPNQPGRIFNVGTGSLGRTSGSVATNGGTGNYGQGGSGPPLVGVNPVPIRTNTSARRNRPLGPGAQ